MSNVFVLEDSSKVGFGGGQRVTLACIDAIKDIADVTLFDFTEESSFIKFAKNSDFEIVLLRAMQAESVLDKFLSPVYLFSWIFDNIKSIKMRARELNVKNFVLYPTAKKGLILAFFYNIFYKVPYLYHAHLIEPPLLALFVRLLCFNATVVVCVSEVVQAQFRSVKAVTVANGISSAFHVKPRKAPKRVVVACVSSLKREKGVEFFAQLPRKSLVPHAEYEIYGDGPLLSKLQSCDGLKVMGRVDDIPAVLNSRIGLLIIPSLIPESFSLVCLEAMSCGVPVIATNLGMQSKHVLNSQAGLLVKPADSAAIIDAIRCILADSEMYETCSRNGIEYSKKFNLTDFQGRIRLIFNNIIQSYR